MKYLILTIACSLFFSSHSDAQHGNAQRGDAQHIELKGPAAKNSKLWEVTNPTSTLLVTQHHKHTGPIAKNCTVWQEDQEMMAVAFVEHQDLKGPKAKNTSPFEEIEQDTYQLAIRRKRSAYKNNMAIDKAL